jgi:uncharacterized protein (DUF58 family)
MIRKAAGVVAARPRLSRRGQAILIAAFLSLILGLIIADQVLSEMALFCLFLVGLVIPVAALNMRGVTVSHAIPDQVYRNEQFEVDLSLERKGGFLDCYDVSVSDSIFKTGPKGGVCHFSSVRPSERVVKTLPARMKRRGIFKGFEFTLTSRFPLGLAVHTQTRSVDDSIAVYPAPRLPMKIRRVLEAGIGTGRKHSRSPSDMTGDFKSMREYRAGDHIKRVSWCLSARFQTLIVKEFEQPCLERVSIFFHSYEPLGVVLSRRSFEKSLQLLSGLFSYFGEGFIPFDFTAQFNGWRTVPVPPDRSAHREVHTLLATARMTAVRDLADLGAALGCRSHGDAPVVIVSNTPIRLWRSAVSDSAERVFMMDNSAAGVFVARGRRWQI